MLIVCAGGVLLSASESSQRKKARYYYNAGSIRQALGDEASAYEYYRKAYETDPTYEEAALSYGTRRLMVATDTMQSEPELNRSLGMMRNYVDTYPGDIYESMYYGYVAGQLDTLPEAVRVLERSFELSPSMTNILLELSEAYARGNNIGKAVESLTRFEQAEGMNPQLTFRKVSYLLADKDTVGALREVTRLVNSAPNDGGNRLLKGQVMDFIGLRDSALYYYQQAEQLEPEASAPKFALANHYRAKGDSVNYDAKIYEVLLTEDLDADQKTDLLATYLQTLLNDKQNKSRGDYLFSVLRDQYPHEPRLLALGARYSAAKENYKDAEEQISYALDLDPLNTVYWGQLMTYQAIDNRPKEAMQTFKRAQEHISPDDNLRYYYASVAQMDSDYKAAVQVYADMIHDIQPSLKVDSVLTLRDVTPDITVENLDKLSVLFTNIGDALHASGDFAGSYRAYDNAITFDSSNVLAKNNYAYFLATNGGDLDKALRLSEGTITGMNADNPTYLDTYAWINFLKGNLDTAAEYQKKAIDAIGEDGYATSELFDHYGDILAAQQRWGDAATAWKRALEVAAKNQESDTPALSAIREKLKEAETKAPAGASSEESSESIEK